MQRMPTKTRLMLFISSTRGFTGTLIELGKRLGFETVLVNKCLTELANEGLVSVETNGETQQQTLKITRKGKAKVLEIYFAMYWYAVLALAVVFWTYSLWWGQSSLGVPISPGLGAVVIVSLAVLVAILLWLLRRMNKNWLRSEEHGL